MSDKKILTDTEKKSKLAFETAKKKAAKAAAKAEKSGKANKESGVDFSVLDKTVTSTKDSSKKDIDKGINKVIAKTKKGSDKENEEMRLNAPKKEQDKLSVVLADMKKLGGEYKEARIAKDDGKMDLLRGELIKLRTQKKRLLDKEDKRVSNIGKNQEFQAED